MIPINTAVIDERIFFLLNSLGVQMALKSDTIHAMESMRKITPKLPVISFFNRSATSRGSIPNVVTKNCASPGLNTIYARKLPKNITATRNIDQIHLRSVRGFMGSFFFLGGSISPLHHGVVSHCIGEVEVSGIVTSSHREAEMISERRDHDVF